jgi:pSer/pThr/pTyr-binding forkhead associated (FHA) protein
VRERTGERFFITKPEFKIGKSRLHADYAIDGNTAISRIHCLVVQKNGVNYIKDNASTNGTFVDENKVNAGEEVLLKDGVTVRLGDEIFTFHLKRR